CRYLPPIATLTRPLEGRDMSVQENLARFDAYRFIHKALRAFMADTLLLWSSADPFDACEVAEALQQLRALLDMCRGHLEHEDRFVHPAMEARAGGSAAATAADHREHERALAALARDALAVEESVGAGRSAAVASLYRRLARFIGENFVHMDD